MWLAEVQLGLLSVKGGKELKCLNSGMQDSVCWLEVGQNRPGAPLCTELLYWTPNPCQKGLSTCTESLTELEGKILWVTLVKLHLFVGDHLGQSQLEIFLSHPILSGWKGKLVKRCHKIQNVTICISYSTPKREFCTFVSCQHNLWVGSLYVWYLILFILWLQFEVTSWYRSDSERLIGTGRCWWRFNLLYRWISVAVILPATPGFYFSQTAFWHSGQIT